MLIVQQGQTNKNLTVWWGRVSFRSLIYDVKVLRVNVSYNSKIKSKCGFTYN